MAVENKKKVESEMKKWRSAMGGGRKMQMRVRICTHRERSAKMHVVDIQHKKWEILAMLMHTCEMYIC